MHIGFATFDRFRDQGMKGDPDVGFGSPIPENITNAGARPKSVIREAPAPPVERPPEPPTPAQCAQNSIQPEPEQMAPLLGNEL